MLIAALLLNAGLLAAAPSAADDAPYARQDIVDARAGYLPERHHALGWTADGAIALRTALPIADAATNFQAAITITSDGKPATTGLADIMCDDQRCAIPYEAARDFIVAERRALAALPPLLPATLRATHPYTLRVVAGDHTKRRPYGQRLELVADGRPIGVVTDVWTDPEADPDRIERPRIAAVYAGPDGRTAVVVAWDLGFNCWSAPQLTTLVVAAP
jgi:hypothetical protein